MKCVSCGKTKSKEKYCLKCINRINENLEARIIRKRLKEQVVKIIINGFITLPSREWFIKSMTTNSKVLKNTRFKNKVHIREIANQILKIIDE